MSRTVRVFISSPSDVRPERLVAERVVKRLDREFSVHFRVEAALWEREPLTADAHFQDLILPPSAADIVVVTLWSRLGVPLPAERYTGAVSGTRPVTGTEWEFEDALNAKQVNGSPDLLFYLKTAPVLADLGNTEVLEQRGRQKRMVDAFITRWFRDSDGLAFTASFREYESAHEFDALLEEHLRALLMRRVSDSAAAEAEAIRWTEPPYRGLLPFDYAQAPVFFGRAKARNELRDLLARQAERRCAFVLVLGSSGSGKSSLVRAGLLPDLMLPGMIGNVALCRFALMRPSDLAGDYLGSLSQALTATTALPELQELNYDATRLTAQAARDPQQVAFAVEQGLSLAGRTARLNPGAEARLVVVVDQLEELFTDPERSDTAIEQFVQALDALARGGHAWVVATMRSDFFDHLESAPELARLSAGEGRYLVTPPDLAELGQIIRQPAREAGVSFEASADDGKPLDQLVLEAAHKDKGALPLLSFALDQLWRRRSERGLLTFAAYEALGGLEGAIARQAESVLTNLPVELQAALPALLRAVTTVAADSSAKPTSRPAPLDSFAAGSPGRHLADALTGAEARIMVAEDAGGQVYLRLAHEALLSHWPRARDQMARERAMLQARSRLRESAQRWLDGERHRSLLLRPGMPLSEGLALTRDHGAELDEASRALVEESNRAARGARRRWMAAAAVAILSSGVLGTYLWYAAEAVAVVETRRAKAAALDLTGALIAYAGSPGETVSDGEGDHGLYTEALLTQLTRTNLSLTEAVISAHDAVRRNPSNRQTPQLLTSLNGDLFLSAPPPQRATRVLVIGNSAYQNLSKLKNPVNDARAMAEQFRAYGYEVTLKTEVTVADLREAVKEFIASLRAAPAAQGQLDDTRHSGALDFPFRSAHAGVVLMKQEPRGRPPPNTVAIVYFAGSGVEVAGRSLFPGIDSKGRNRSDVGAWFDISSFIEQLESVAAARAVIMDFCRDDPFATNTR